MIEELEPDYATYMNAISPSATVVARPASAIR
jgi:hypothetical protein